MARWNMDIPPCDAAEYARLKRVEEAAVEMVEYLKFAYAGLPKWAFPLRDALTDDLIEEPSNA